MIFRQKTQKAAIAFVVISTTAPISVTARNYLHSMEKSLNENMQSMRIELTRASNKNHVLNAYAMRLSWDSSLRNVVNQHKEPKTHWQTLSQRVQLRILDSFNKSVRNQIDISSASLEWLEPTDSNFHAWGDAQQVWLTASVSSVSHAIELMASIEDMAKPFPLLAEGCSYQQSKELIGVNFQCLFTLITWELPKMVALVEDKRSSSAQAAQLVAQLAAYPTVHPTIAPLKHTRNQWRLFSSEISVPSLTDAEHLITPVKGLTDKPANAPLLITNPARGVIIGPAGTLVLNAITK